MSYRLKNLPKWVGFHFGEGIVLSDDLYCKQPFCEQLIQMKKHTISSLSVVWFYRVTIIDRDGEKKRFVGWAKVFFVPIFYGM